MLVIKAEYIGAGARSAKEDNAKGLGAELCLALGYKVILTSNIWIENGLCNGSISTIRDII